MKLDAKRSVVMLRDRCEFLQNEDAKTKGGFE